MKLSIILIDWKVRESFHAIEFLNRQDMAREEYEIIWVEHYDHRPAALVDAHARGLIDQWIVLGETGLYFKHRLYNEGLLAARGEIITVCDSDACFSPRFVRSVVESFAASNVPMVLYHEEVRSDNKEFYPFPRGATWNRIMEAPGLMNWDSVSARPSGFASRHDRLHTLNYGACFSCLKSDALAVGGFDVHPHYHGFMCGPYELGFRLENAGRREQWCQDEWLLHTWHPWVRPEVDALGHHDGRHVSSLALEARRTGRVLPYVEDARVRVLRLAMPGSPSAPPRSDRLPVIEPTSPPRRSSRIALHLAPSPRLDRALLLTEFHADDATLASLEASGLIAELEVFAYDSYVHRFGQTFMQEQLSILCRQFRPELIIFRPLAERMTEGDSIEPSPEVLRALADVAGARLFLDEPAAARMEEWSAVADAVGLPCGREFPGQEKNAQTSLGRPLVVATWPSPDDRVFHASRSVRDVAIFADGPIVCGTAKERYLTVLKDEGADLRVRRVAMRPPERAAVYSRARVVINHADDVAQLDDAARLDDVSGGAPIFRDAVASGEEPARAMEAMACGACLVQDAAIPMPPAFIAGRDYLSYADAAGLSQALAEAARPGVATRIGASGRARVAAVMAPRPFWIGLFEAMDIQRKRGPSRTVKHWLHSSEWARSLARRAEKQRLRSLRKVAVFGAGPSGVACAESLEKLGIEIVAYLDNALDRQNKVLRGRPIHPPKWIMTAGASSIDGVVLGFQGRKNSARWQLADLGYQGTVIDFEELSAS